MTEEIIDERLTQADSDRSKKIEACVELVEVMKGIKKIKNLLSL